MTVHPMNYPPSPQHAFLPKSTTFDPTRTTLNCQNPFQIDFAPVGRSGQYKHM